MNIKNRLSKLEQRTVPENSPLPIEKALEALEDPELMERYKDNPTVKLLKVYEGDEF